MFKILNDFSTGFLVVIGVAIAGLGLYVLFNYFSTTFWILISLFIIWLIGFLINEF